MKYEELYNDMAEVIQGGLTTKEFKEINENKEMSASNQFTREVL
jgi:hypothetical protein